MSGKKNNRQRQRRQQAARNARARAVAQRQKQEQKKKRTVYVAIGVAVAAVVLLGVALSAGGNGKSTDVTSSSSTTQAGADSTEPEDTTPAPESAKGKPCVARVDPLPAGAPEVNVKVGPPPTTLIKEDIKPGTGDEVPAGATITVNYIGVACTTGKIFDSSYSRNQPATFPLTGVIKGWTDGIPGMKVGGQRLLGIPSDLAYGPSGQGGDIAPDEPLWFVVEVLKIG
jgi:peptidylprolyl isomerase